MFKDTAQHTLNLLSNAVKFSDVDLDLNILVENDQVAMSVRDKGMGVPEDKQQHLFKRFLGQKMLSRFKELALDSISLNAIRHYWGELSSLAVN